jgi:hypothetical protein
MSYGPLKINGRFEEIWRTLLLGREEATQGTSIHYEELYLLRCLIAR